MKERKGRRKERWKDGVMCEKIGKDCRDCRRAIDVLSITAQSFLRDKNDILDSYPTLSEIQSCQSRGRICAREGVSGMYVVGAVDGVGGVEWDGRGLLYGWIGSRDVRIWEG